MSTTTTTTTAVMKVGMMSVPNRVRVRMRVRARSNHYSRTTTTTTTTTTIKAKPLYSPKPKPTKPKPKSALPLTPTSAIYRDGLGPGPGPGPGPGLAWATYNNNNIYNNYYNNYNIKWQSLFCCSSSHIRGDLTCRFSSSSSSSSSSSVMGSEEEENHNPKPKEAQFLTIPTLLTLARVAAVPLLISTFYVESWWGTTATTSIFIAAAITDWLDGYIARKMKLGSAFGAFLDPVADKLMVAATLVLLCTRPLDVGSLGQVPWLLTVPAIAIIGREITMSAVREWAASQNTKLLEAVAVNNLGKWKTATQMTALTILLATRNTGIEGQGIIVASGVALLYTSAGLAVWSLGVYISKIWKVLIK